VSSKESVLQSIRDGLVKHAKLGMVAAEKYDKPHALVDLPSHIFDYISKFEVPGVLLGKPVKLLPGMVESSFKKRIFFCDKENPGTQLSGVTVVEFFLGGGDVT